MNAPTEDREGPRLKFFDSGAAAIARARRAQVSRHVQAIACPSGTFLKQVGAAGIEPTFLCRDGRWRKYDSVMDLRDGWVDLIDGRHPALAFVKAMTRAGVSEADAASAFFSRPLNHIPCYQGISGHHPVNKWPLVFHFVQDVAEGKTVTPYVVCHRSKRLMSGHHRSAANEVLERLGVERRIDILDYEDVRSDADWFSKYG